MQKSCFAVYKGYLALPFISLGQSTQSLEWLEPIGLKSCKINKSNNEISQIRFHLIRLKPIFYSSSCILKVPSLLLRLHLINRYNSFLPRCSFHLIFQRNLRKILPNNEPLSRFHNKNVKLLLLDRRLHRHEQKISNLQRFDYPLKWSTTIPHRSLHISMLWLWNTSYR